jgi:hypothetical protein
MRIPPMKRWPRCIAIAYIVFGMSLWSLDLVRISFFRGEIYSPYQHAMRYIVPFSGTCPTVKKCEIDVPEAIAWFVFENTPINEYRMRRQHDCFWGYANCSGHIGLEDLSFWFFDIIWGAIFYFFSAILVVKAIELWKTQKANRLSGKH